MAQSVVSITSVTEVLDLVGIEAPIFICTLLFALLFRASGFFANGNQTGVKSAAAPLKSADVCDSPSRKPEACQRSVPRGVQQESKHVARELNRLMDKMLSCGTRGNASEALETYAELRALGQLRVLKTHDKPPRRSALEIYTMLAQCVGRVNRPELIEMLINDMRRTEVERPIGFYESTMKLLASKKYFAEALAVYTQLEADGLDPSPVTLSCLINFATELGKLDRAISFFERLSSVSTPSIRAYMTILRVHAKRQDWHSSLSVVRDMQRRQAHIDSLALNIILATGVSCGELVGARALLDELSKSQPPIPDVISYNTLIKGYAQQKEAEDAIKILDQMCQQGLRPNAITFNTVMDAAVRASRYSVAWHVLERMREAGLAPDKFTCTTLMKSLQEGGTAEQLTVFLNVMKFVKSDCDPALFRSAIEAAVRLKNADLATQAAKQMGEQGVSLSTSDHQHLLQVLLRDEESKRCSARCRLILLESSPDASWLAWGTSVTTCEKKALSRA